MKYRNKSKQTQALIGFGVVEPNGVIETKEEINNPNFELVTINGGVAEKKETPEEKVTRPKKGRIK